MKIFFSERHAALIENDYGNVEEVHHKHSANLEPDLQKHNKKEREHQEQELRDCLSFFRKEGKKEGLTWDAKRSLMNAVADDKALLREIKRRRVLGCTIL